MNSAVLVAVSITVPLVCLGLLMTLSWLEDSLDDESTRLDLSQPHLPILTMPVEADAVVDAEVDAVQISPSTEPDVGMATPAT